MCDSRIPLKKSEKSHMPSMNCGKESVVRSMTISVEKVEFWKISLKKSNVQNPPYYSTQKFQQNNHKFLLVR